MTFEWFRLPLLLMVSLSFSHSTHAVLLFLGIRIIIIVVVVVVGVVEWSPTSLTRFHWTTSGLTAGFYGLSLKQYIQTALYCFATR